MGQMRFRRESTRSLLRRPGFPCVSVRLEVGRPTYSGGRGEDYSEPDVYLAVLIKPLVAGSPGAEGEKRRTVDYNEVRPSVVVADRKNIHQRWRVNGNRQLFFWHVKDAHIAVLLRFRRGRLDLYPYDGFVTSLDDEDIVPNIHFRDGDIDASVEELGHHRQLATPTKKCAAAAGFGIVCRRCPDLIRRARKNGSRRPADYGRIGRLADYIRRNDRLHWSW